MDPLGMMFKFCDPPHWGVVAQRYVGIGSPIFLAFYLIFTESGIGAQIDILIKILQDCFSSIIFILKFGYHGISHSKDKVQVVIK